MHPSNSPAPDRVEEYLKLLSEFENSLRLYVISMLPVLADAEDIIQDTKMTAWKDFHAYESETHFGAWLRKIAFNRILAFRKRKAIEKRKLVFSDEFYEVVDRVTEIEDGHIHDRMQSLLKCIGKLQKSHHDLIAFRYQNRLSIEEVAKKMNRSVTATYRLVSRIRVALKNCVQLQEQAKV